MDAVYDNIESVFFLITRYAVLAIEIIGVIVMLFSVVRALVGIFKKEKTVRLKLAQGIALSLEFEMGGEILHVVMARKWEELLVLGAVILLRGAMAVLIHWEIKGHKRDINEENEVEKLLAEQEEIPETVKLNAPENEQNTAVISENKVVSELESDVYRTNEVREKSK